MKKKETKPGKKTRLQKNFQQTVLKYYRKKNVDEITINEVCKKLGVPRSSFYYHYKTIRDVIAEIQNDFIKANKNALATVKLTGDEKKDFVNCFDAIMPIIKNNENLVRAFANERYDSEFIRAWIQTICEGYSKEPGHREHVIAFLTIFGVADYLNNSVSLSSFKPEAAYEASAHVYDIKAKFYSALTK